MTNKSGSRGSQGSESSLHGNAALVRAGTVIGKGQSSRKGFEASVSIYVAFWTNSSALVDIYSSAMISSLTMASLNSCTGVLLDVGPWCFDQRAWCMGAGVSSNLPGVSTNARADDTIPRPFWNARVATMLTVAKLISRLSLHLALANIHHAKLSFCSRDPSTFEAPLIPASLGTWELNLIPSCLVWWGIARIC